MQLARTTSGTKKSWGTYIVTFILLTCCFILWGITNGLAPHLGDIYMRTFLLKPGESMMQEWALQIGYFLLALPAGLFIRRFTYRSGVLIGMVIFTVATMLYYPFAMIGSFGPLVFLSFLSGAALSFLETSASPYVIALGESRLSMVRLNLAQSFNTIGWLIGSYLVIENVSEYFSPFSMEQRRGLSEELFESMKSLDLQVVGAVEMILCVVVTTVALSVALFSKMPKDDSGSRHEPLAMRYIFDTLVHSRSYMLGVLALAFYVAAQTTCWSSITHYGVDVLTATGDYVVSQAIRQTRHLLMNALVSFGVMRFVCSLTMLKVDAYRLLIGASVIAMAFSLVALMSGGEWQIYSMIVVSGCMSLMFPTIFCYALRGLDIDTAKVGSAGLVMTISVGNLLPILQTYLLRLSHGGGSPEPMKPFYLLIVSFGVILSYGLSVARRHR